MALEVHVYTVTTQSGEPALYPACDFYTFDYEEAKGYAQEERLVVIDNTYEWSDSEVLDDYSGEECE